MGRSKQTPRSHTLYISSKQQSRVQNYWRRTCRGSSVLPPNTKISLFAIRFCFMFTPQYFNHVRSQPYGLLKCTELFDLETSLRPIHTSTHTATNYIILLQCSIESTPDPCPSFPTPSSNVTILLISLEVHDHAGKTRTTFDLSSAQTQDLVLYAEYQHSYRWYPPSLEMTIVGAFTFHFVSPPAYPLSFTMK